MISLMLQILGVLPKAMHQVSTYETGKASKQPKGDFCSLFMFFAVPKKVMSTYS